MAPRHEPGDGEDRDLREPSGPRAVPRVARRARSAIRPRGPRVRPDGQPLPPARAVARCPALGVPMHWLDMRYARYFNGSHGRVGAFFRGRFTSRLVEDEAYLGWLPVYIHINPVKDGFVTCPHDWRWSSYRQVVGLERGHRWLATDVVGRGFDPADYRGLTERAAARPCPTTRPSSADRLWEAWAGVGRQPTLAVETIESGVATCVRTGALGVAAPRWEPAESCSNDRHRVARVAIGPHSGRDRRPLRALVARSRVFGDSTSEASPR